jgi:hypothetical protein
LVKREGLPSWAGMDSFLAVRSVWIVQAAISTAAGVRSHWLSIGGGSTPFFEEMIVRGDFGAGHE